MILAQVAEEASTGGVSFQPSELINILTTWGLIIGTLAGGVFAAFRTGRKRFESWIEATFPGKAERERGATEEELSGFKTSIDEIKSKLDDVEMITKLHDENQRQSAALTGERFNGLDRSINTIRDQIDSRTQFIDQRIERLDHRIDDMESNQAAALAAQREILSHVERHEEQINERETG